MKAAKIKYFNFNKLFTSILLIVFVLKNVSLEELDNAMDLIVEEAKEDFGNLEEVQNNQVNDIKLEDLETDDWEQANKFNAVCKEFNLKKGGTIHR